MSTALLIIDMQMMMHDRIGGGEHAVFFDSPLRGACGIRVDASTVEPTAALIDCDLGDIEPLTITGSNNLDGSKG